jgi:hypothetical protein
LKWLFFSAVVVVVRCKWLKKVMNFQEEVILWNVEEARKK